MEQVSSATRTQGFPTPIFIHRASVEAAEKFFETRAPQARAIADSAGSLFRAFGLQRGTLMQLLGPAVWWSALRAVFRGNFVGKPTGNEAQMPGAFLVRGRKIVWQHRARHAGDHPDLGAMLRALDPERSSDAPAKGAATKAPNKNLVAEYHRLLVEARDAQRSGDIRGFAAKTERAEDLGRQIDASEEQRA